MSQQQRFTYAPLSAYQPNTSSQTQPSYQPLPEYRSTGQPIYQNSINTAATSGQIRNVPSTQYTFGGAVPTVSTQPYRISFNHGPSTIVPISSGSINSKPISLQSPPPTQQQSPKVVTETSYEKAPAVSKSSQYNIDVNEFKTIRQGDFKEGWCSCFSPVTFESNQQKHWC